MGMETILIWLVIGAIAGWLAGVIMKGNDFGLVGNIAVGIVGSVIGGWLFGVLFVGTAGGIVGSIVSATIGAVILLFVIRLVRRAT